MQAAIESGSQQWMSLWLAGIQARIDIALRESAGRTTEEAERVLASIDTQLERLRPEIQHIPAAWLSSRLGLSRTEETVVWLLVASACSPTIRTALCALAGGPDEPTLDVIRHVVYRAPEMALTAWRELGADGVLAQLGLVMTSDADRRRPDYRRSIQLADRVRGLVLGDMALDPAVAGVARVDVNAPLLEDVVAPAAAIATVQAHAAGPRPFVLIVGPVGVGRTTLLRAALAKTGRRSIVVDAGALARQGETLRAQLQVLVREARLLDRVLLLRGLDALIGSEGAEERATVVEQVIGQSTVPLFATARQRPSALRSSRTIVTVTLGSFTAAQRAQLWEQAIPGASEEEYAALGSMYPLAPAVIHAVGQALEARRPLIPSPELLRATLDAVVDARMTGLADRVNVTQTWDDLVLPSEQHGSLLELMLRVRERSRVYEQWGFGTKLGKGLGVAALFSGPPGTGKTMAAGLIANELGLPLYRVDLSQLVSKYIGETEKSLAALFDAAESTACVLLFDEADSLFGKRTEVKSSNDRYANLEVNYLLQRLEAFTGICLLTTNHERAIDEAFTRRLAFHVRFSMPEVDERARLWSALLPSGAPVAPALDFEGLGHRIALSGGHIRNAVLRAAFFAASDGGPITMDHLWRAAVLEYEATGKLAPA
jgi:hypothetical protein